MPPTKLLSASGTSSTSKVLVPKAYEKTLAVSSVLKDLTSLGPEPNTKLHAPSKLVLGSESSQTLIPASLSQV